MTLAEIIAQDRAQALEQIKAQSQKVQQWYQQQHPSDSMAKYIDPDLTFAQVMACLRNGVYCYDTFFAGDSFIRTSILAHIAKIYHVDYKTIYVLWLAAQDVNMDQYRGCENLCVSVEPCSNLIVVEYTRDGQAGKDLYGQPDHNTKGYYYILPLGADGQPTGQVWPIYCTLEQAKTINQSHHYIYNERYEAEWRAQQ